MTAEEIHSTDETAAPDALGVVPPSAPQSGGILKAMRQGNRPLIVLLAAGIACVYLLSLRPGPARLSAQERAEEAEVESALAQWCGQAEPPEAPTPAGTLVEAFYYETKQRQVPIDRVSGNPFEYKTPEERQPSLHAAPAKEEQAPPAATRYTDAQAAVRQLQLQSILAGSAGATAMISNNILTEGQVISGWTVSKIEPQSVTLTWNDQTYELKMRSGEQ